MLPAIWEQQTFIDRAGPANCSTPSACRFVDAVRRGLIGPEERKEKI
jgi:hypothetical protein